MEKMMAGMASIQYESINDRISRLRKETASVNRTKDRTTYQPGFDKYDKMYEIDKILKQGNSNRLKFDTSSMRLDINMQSILSPRKCGISKRPHYRYPTQDDKRQCQNKAENRNQTARIPGKICKNISKLSLVPQPNQMLRLNAKYNI